MRALVVDNGGGSVKAGWADSDACRLFPNAIVRSKADGRLLVADELEACRDYRGLVFRRPFERGLLSHWEAERIIWDRVFSALSVDPKETTLLVTEPPLNLPALQDSYDEVIFETFEFDGCWRTTAPFLASQASSAHAPPAVLVIDSGFSATHIVPFFQGFQVGPAVRRVNVGGKALTNFLKEIISYRTWNMMDEFFIVDRVKEACCYVPLDFMKQLQSAQNAPASHRVDYVLPDQVNSRTGYLRQAHADAPLPDEQLLTLNNERITVPELLFHPSNIGMNQCGIGEAAVDALRACPAELHASLLSNIVLVGGNARFPGYRERVLSELRQRVPADQPVALLPVDDPITHAWSGGRALCADEHVLRRFAVTRQEYQEGGSERCRRRFVV